MNENLILELKSFARNEFNKEEWLESWSAIPEGLKYLEAHKKMSHSGKINLMDPDSQLKYEKIFVLVPRIDTDNNDFNELVPGVNTSDVKFDEKDINEMKEIVKVMNPAGKSEIFEDERAEEDAIKYSENAARYKFMWQLLKTSIESYAKTNIRFKDLMNDMENVYLSNEYIEPQI